MRQAPAVSLRCTAGPGWRALGAGLPALAMANLLLWLLPWAGLALPAAAAAASALAVAMAWLLWRRVPARPMLSWDGSRWTLDGTPVAPAVAIAWPGERWLRVHQAGAAVRWVAVAARPAGAAWHPLCVALHAHGGRPEESPR